MRLARLFAAQRLVRLALEHLDAATSETTPEAVLESVAEEARRILGDALRALGRGTGP